MQHTKTNRIKCYAEFQGAYSCICGLYSVHQKIASVSRGLQAQTGEQHHLYMRSAKETKKKQQRKGRYFHQAHWHMYKKKKAFCWMLSLAPLGLQPEDRDMDFGHVVDVGPALWASVFMLSIVLREFAIAPEAASHSLHTDNWPSVFLVTHLSVVLVFLVLLFAPQAEQFLQQSFFAVMSYASPLSNFIWSCWCCAAFTTFPLLCTVFAAPLRYDGAQIHNVDVLYAAARGHRCKQNMDE